MLSEAEKLLCDILEHGDITGRDATGRTILELAVPLPLLDRMIEFGADLAESEDGGDYEL